MVSALLLQEVRSKEINLLKNLISCLLISCKKQRFESPVGLSKQQVPASYPPTAAAAESCSIFSNSASDLPIRIGSTPRPFITSAVL